MAELLRRLLIAAAILSAIACKGDHAPAAPAVVPGAPAGDVTELSGDVAATHDGKTRALAKGDVVAGDDLIATGADGRVTITLRHNQVAWSLGPNKSKKVADSAAWSAAKGARAEETTDDHSAAAGRHAERSATDTSASVGAGSAAASDQQAQQAQQLQQAKDDAEREAIERQLAEAQQQQVTAAKGHATDHASDHRRNASTCDPGDPLCDDVGGSAPGGGGEVEGAIDPEAIRRVIRGHAGDFSRCYEQLLKSAPDAKGKLVMHLTIGAGGRVPSATVDGDAALQPMFACVQTAARTLVFPEPHGTIDITYPLVFSGP